MDSFVPSLDTFGVANAQSTTLTQQNMDAWLYGDRYDMPTLTAAYGDAPGPWERLMQYGITRAIDNRYGPVPVAGNTNAGTFAGANGRTYGNTGTNQAGRTIAGAVGMDAGDMVLIGLVVLGVYLAAQ